MNEQLMNADRQPCEVFSRVMGYHRSTDYWNAGKQQEHRDRKYFLESLAFQSFQHIGAHEEESE